MIADDEGPMHVIVKQIKNEAKGRSDLTGWRPQRKYRPHRN